MGPVRARLDARRWHFQHGPIDLVLEAFGERAAVVDASESAWSRFQTVLQELVDELPLLRSPVAEAGNVQGAVARRMVAACWPYREEFITPMAAVAGAVADEILAAMGSAVPKAYVNDGGDIALHLAAGESFRVGTVIDPEDATRHGHRVTLDGSFEVTARMPVRGVATSGWRGRSWSLGIADSVTVLAETGASADAAATMVGNAVNIDHPRIMRRPASEVDDMTDLGMHLVTVEVGALPSEAITAALASGTSYTATLVERGLVWGAVLTLQSQYRVVGGITRAALAS